MIVPMPKEVEQLDAVLQRYMGNEALNFFSFLTKGKTCPKHEISLEVTTDNHVQCGACFQEALDHENYL